MYHSDSDLNPYLFPKDQPEFRSCHPPPDNLPILSNLILTDHLPLLLSRVEVSVQDGRVVETKLYRNSSSRALYSPRVKGDLVRWDQ